MLGRWPRFLLSHRFTLSASSFCREVFGHVVYHIIKAPIGAGDTRFAHLGAAYDRLAPPVQARLRRCASVNSNGGAVHPLAAPHPVSGRLSLYLHLGMTGAMLEVPSASSVGAAGDSSAAPPDVTDAASSSASAATSSPASATADGFGDGSTPEGLPRPKPGATTARLGLRPEVLAWRDEEMDSFFCAFSKLLDDASVSYSHKWVRVRYARMRSARETRSAREGGHQYHSLLETVERHRLTSASTPQRLLSIALDCISTALGRISLSLSPAQEEGDVVIIDNLAVAHKAAPGAHTLDSGLRILHRTTILSARPHDPPAHLGLPNELPTTRACPFEGGAATWKEGYVRVVPMSSPPPRAFRAFSPFHSRGSPLTVPRMLLR